MAESSLTHPAPTLMEVTSASESEPASIQESLALPHLILPQTAAVAPLTPPDSPSSSTSNRSFIMDSDSELKSSSDGSSVDSMPDPGYFQYWPTLHSSASLLINRATNTSTTQQHVLGTNSWSGSTLASSGALNSIITDSELGRQSSNTASVMTPGELETIDEAAHEERCEPEATITHSEDFSNKVSVPSWVSGKAGKHLTSELLNPPYQLSKSPYTRAELRHANHSDVDIHHLQLELKHPYHQSIEAELSRCGTLPVAVAGNLGNAMQNENAKKKQRSRHYDDGILLAHQEFWKLVDDQLTDETALSISCMSNEKREEQEINAIDSSSSNNIAIVEATSPATQVFQQDDLIEVQRCLQVRLENMAERIDGHCLCVDNIDAVMAQASLNMLELEDVKLTCANYKHLHLDQIARIEQQKRWLLTRIQLAGADNRFEALLELGESFVNECFAKLKPALLQLFDFLAACERYCDDDDTPILKLVLVAGSLVLWVFLMWTASRIGS